MKSTSAGLILTDGTRFLGCHSTGNYFYDLPKGTIEENERPVEACMREAKEETGFVFNEEDVRDLGVFDYNLYKDLHLFVMVQDELPDIKRFFCTSYFYDPDMKTNRPEVDGFKYIDFDRMEFDLTKNMFNVLNTVQQKIKEMKKQPS